MDAKNHPVNQPQKEVHSDDVKIRQRRARNLDTFDGENESEIAIAEGLGNGSKDEEEAYRAALAFMQEPVTIVISTPSEKNPAKVVPVWVNGEGAEVLSAQGKWMKNGWLPVGVPVTTRRKYVEVLARAKHENVETKVIKHEAFEENLAPRTSSVKFPFSVQKDSPQGYEWLNKVLMGQ